jgi:hypothetical protein
MPNLDMAPLAVYMPFGSPLFLLWPMAGGGGVSVSQAAPPPPASAAISSVLFGTGAPPAQPVQAAPPAGWGVAAAVQPVCASFVAYLPEAGNIII